MSTYNQTQARPQEDAVAEAAAPKTANVKISTEKAATAFRTISEVADELNVQQHVLRFWETKFTQIKPLKRGGGRRYYRPEDVALLRRIHHLLYTEGYTIKGVQKLLKGQGKTQIVAAEPAMASVAVAPAPVVAKAAPAAVVETVTAPAAVADMKPGKPPLSDKQKAILEAMLGDLRDLRDMLRGDDVSA